MAYESWSQVVIRTVIEWEKQKELKFASATLEPKPEMKRKHKIA